MLIFSKLIWLLIHKSTLINSRFTKGSLSFESLVYIFHLKCIHWNWYIQMRERYPVNIFVYWMPLMYSMHMLLKIWMIMIILYLQIYILLIQCTFFIRENFIKIYTQIEYFNKPPCAKYLISKTANLWLLLFHPCLIFSLSWRSTIPLCSIFRCVGLMDFHGSQD